MASSASNETGQPVFAEIFERRGPLYKTKISLARTPNSRYLRKAHMPDCKKQYLLKIKSMLHIRESATIMTYEGLKKEILLQPVKLHSFDSVY